jgi:ABC-2 type transport system permease protein
MPIHDQSYRRYAGSRAPDGRAWAVIATAGIRTMLAKRKFLGLVLLAWLPFIVRAVQFYLVANFPQMTIIAPSAETFREFLAQQNVFVFFITIFTGAGLIANDQRANALQIYLSKPLSRVEYVAGKFSVLAFFLILVTWLPAILLVFLQVVFSGSLAFLKANLFVLPAITVFALLQVIVSAFSMLALSSLSKSARFVGIMYAGLIFFTDALYGVVFVVTRNTAFSWISLPGNLRQIGDIIFRVGPRYDTSAAVTLLAILALVGLSVLVLERRVRGVEVVT